MTSARYLPNLCACVGKLDARRAEVAKRDKLSMEINNFFIPLDSHLSYFDLIFIIRKLAAGQAAVVRTAPLASLTCPRAVPYIHRREAGLRNVGENKSLFFF